MLLSHQKPHFRVERKFIYCKI
uniref:Uncharacterized protein n=1 Tax=Rhizophora mucronata TaxID=61149 RepID=A0A2P2PQA6_RHIMU